MSSDNASPKNREHVVPLTSEEKLWYSALFVGKYTCPTCRVLIPVMNNHGIEGDTKSDYFTRHKKIGTSLLCDYSLQPIA